MLERNFAGKKKQLVSNAVRNTKSLSYPQNYFYHFRHVCRVILFQNVKPLTLKLYTKTYETFLLPGKSPSYK